jgi:hypothetical protein
MGSGRYSQELPYNDWLRFNNAQRAHYNFVEGISTSITLLIIGGFYYPVISASFGLAMIIGRMIYSVGYTLRGPAEDNWRRPHRYIALSNISFEHNDRSKNDNGPTFSLTRSI